MHNHDTRDATTRASRLSRRRFLDLLRGSAAASVLAAASPVRDAASAVAPTTGSGPATLGGTLVIAADQIYDNFVPASTFQGWGGIWVLDNIFETLYTFRDFKRLVPALATSHALSDDGLTYTFHLRRGVRFHDGSLFNAEAVEFNYMRYLNKSHPYYEPNAPFRSNFLTDVEYVKAKDDYTVEILRQKPDSGFVSGLSMIQAGIMSPTAIKKFGVKDVGSNPVGTGRFVFDKRDGDQVSIKAFRGHWSGRPPLDRVVVRAIPDPQALTASLLSGEVDLTTFADFKDLPTFRNNPNLKVQSIPMASAGYIGLNRAHPALRDVRARRAVAYAINKQRIIDVIFYGQAEVGGGIVSPPHWAYAPQLKDYYRYDPQKAKDLLQQSGGPRELNLYAMTAGYWPRLAELLQADLNAVGFKTAIEKIDPATFFSQIGQGKHALFTALAVSDHMDPEAILFALFGCNNPRLKRWDFCDPSWDQLRDKQAMEKDQEKRKVMIRDLQRHLLDQVVTLQYEYDRLVTVTNKRVEGYVPLPITHVFLDKTFVTKQ